MVQKGPFKFYAKVTDLNDNIYYFKGVYNSSDEFKTKVKNWYAENIDPVDVYNIRFSQVTNVGKIDGLEESKFTEV
jgi:hypothetical protein